MNPEKTKCICIQTKQMKISKNLWTPSLYIGVTEVDIPESSELLGVVLDDGMDWGRQLGKVAGKLSKVSAILPSTESRGRVMSVTMSPYHPYNLGRVRTKDRHNNSVCDITEHREPRESNECHNVTYHPYNLCRLGPKIDINNSVCDITEHREPRESNEVTMSPYHPYNLGRVRTEDRHK
ncbi:hypothetical protein J6590_081375 [Homalodisca vitripennis]|nr:hypothetical protein J6590_081375 [Homalodisca vitripennis]